MNCYSVMELDDTNWNGVDRSNVLLQSYSSVQWSYRYEWQVHQPVQSIVSESASKFWVVDFDRENDSPETNRTR